MKTSDIRRMFFGISVMFLFVYLGSGCGGDEDSHSTIELAVNYEGTLTLHITNDYPTFDESTDVDAWVNKQGIVTFGSGTLHWEAENQLEHGKTKWIGDLNLNPEGETSYCSGDKVCVDVNENTSFSETVEQYVMYNGNWKKVADDTKTGTWDGGLAFSLDDAIIDGSVVTASTDQGSVTWTLRLLASLQE